MLRLDGLDSTVMVLVLHSGVVLLVVAVDGCGGFGLAESAFEVAVDVEHGVGLRSIQTVSVVVLGLAVAMVVEVAVV